MILRELFEARAKSVGIIFGRFNPPHMGHMKAWEMASENSVWYVGTNKSTQGPKDPLPFDIKVKAMEAVYPEIKGHIVAEQSWLTLASKVYEKHGNIVLNVYTDEAWVTKALVQYNGKEGAHGYYDFGAIQQQDTPRLSSATALRNAVAADDRDLFGQAAGVDPNTLVAGHAFFDVVKHYLMPHAEKAAAKVIKKKVKEPVAELSSELLGRYKKAAGADAKKADADGDYDRGNKRFSGIVRATKKQFSNDEKSVAEGPSNAIANAASRLANKDDGKVAKLRAAGDKRREDQLKGRDIAKRDRTSKDEWGDLKEFSRGDNGDDEGGDDPYKYPDPQQYRRSIDFFGQFEADHFDKENMNDETGEFKGYWDYDGKLRQIAYFKFDNPKRTDSNHPGMGWYYEPQNESVAENAWDRLQRERALESAGVGIITKQNSTVDVNKNTPRKNLKAFRLI